MQRINSGESIEAVIAELDGLAPEQKALLVENAPPVLSNGQKADLMFLASALWVGYGLDSRQAALARIKANGGKITYEDLVDIGVYAPGELAESGTKERRKQERDKYGGPANFPGLLEWNYGLNQQGTSVDLLDQQFREQQMSEAYSVTMLMIGIAAGALVDKWLTGPASEPLGGGEGPLNLGEAPGAGSGGAQTGGAGENGQAEKIGGIGEYIDTTTDSLSKSEKLVVDDLVGQGKTVERIPANPKVEGGTPDFKVNGVLTELKTLENANTNTGMKRIQNGFSQGAESVIIDARASGLTEAQADEIIARVRGKYPNGILPGTVEIWIAGQVRTYP